MDDNEYQIQPYDAIPETTPILAESFKDINEKEDEASSTVSSTTSNSVLFGQVVLEEDGTINTILSSDDNGDVVPDAPNILSKLVELDIESQEKFKELDGITSQVKEDVDDTYADEELEDGIHQNLLPMELNAFEQVRLFLTDAKNFFNSSFIESIASAALSTSSLSTPEIQRTVTDTIIIFSQICKKYMEIEKQYGKLTSRTTLDDIIIESLGRISDQIIGSSIPYSPYSTKNIFIEVSKDPNYFGEVTLNGDLSKKFTKLIENDITLDLSYARLLQKDAESKIKILDVVKSVQNYSSFLSRDAVKCSNMNEFVQRFSEIVNNASTSISEILEDDNTGLTISNVLNTSFFNTVIRTKDVHMKSGIAAFDSITNGGFEKDRVYLFSGKTGGGKSTVLLNLAYGMYKSGNGLFFPEVPLFNKFIESDDNITIFKEYYDANIAEMRREDIARYGKEYGSRKHMLLYVTLENTEFETIKRFMCRMGLVSHIFWMLVERDSNLEQLVKEKGLSFTVNDLPANMPISLKRRLCAMTNYIRILNENNRTEFKVWWKPPYTISTYDIFMEVKKLEREGYIIDAVFIDYPDKMRPIDKDASKSDQSWDTLGKIIDNLKGFSKQASVPVLAVSQLTRQGNKDSGNKGNIIKGGTTAGSQQKESNTDFLINMNIHSKDDNELSSRVDMFKNYQRHINQSRASVIQNLFTAGKGPATRSKLEQIIHFKQLTSQAERATDILQLSFAMPDIQSINNYIVKNRDGISDMVFDTYIVYGMYMVTDYDQEALDAAKFCTQTYIEIVGYMGARGIISEQSHQACSGLHRWFQNRLTMMQMSINDALKSNSGAVNNIANHNKQQQTVIGAPLSTILINSHPFSKE